MNHSFYRLAKDTNALLLVPVALSLAVVVYGLVMRAVGQTLGGVIIATFIPTAITEPFFAGVVRVEDLVTIASLLERSDFNKHDLLGAVSGLTQLYRQTKFDKEMREFQTGEKNKDAVLYLGYAILFLICWFGVFLWLPAESTWKMQNSRAFWPVLSLLLLFLLRNLIHVRELVIGMPTSMISFMAYKIKTDPDAASALDSAKPRLADIEARVESIRLNALREAAAPSLFGFINSRVRDDTDKQKRSSTTRFWAWSVYEEGRRFSQSDRKTEYNDQWLASFAKYVFYRMARAILLQLTLVWSAVLYLTGFDAWFHRMRTRDLELSRLELAATERHGSVVSSVPEQTDAGLASAARGSER
jgi:hypothetical protein